MKGNKGEWSEVYTLLKIVSDQKLFAGDAELNRISDLTFPIVKVLRDETNGSFSFEGDKNVVVMRNNAECFTIPIAQFKNHAEQLLSIIKSQSDSSFSAPAIEAFLNSFQSNSIKAKSSVKSDIRVVIHDLRAGASPELGFSIKSQLGGASTLLNPGKTTNFKFALIGAQLTSSQIAEINAISTSSKIKDRIIKIQSYGLQLKFDSMSNSTFENNLILIDSFLPKIISEMVYLYFTSSKKSKISELINDVANQNPLGFNTKENHPFYLYKVKRFLTDVALGMTPSAVWRGQYDATGGFLVVKDDGDVLCYHIYNKNEFEDYLVANTRLDTASSSRYEFGSVYIQDGKPFLNLNLQIRFLT